MATGLNTATAERFAALTLGHLGREWPNALDQILTGPDDLASPRALHPAFYGSFDWHSCVHGWWQVVRILRLFPAMPLAKSIIQQGNTTFTADNIAGELAFLSSPMSDGFERPYGWAWLLALHNELTRLPECRWASVVEPLARAFAARFADYLPKLTYPIRSGKHDNTAFALILALRWAREHDAPLATQIAEKACAWFGNDRDARPWEPSGEDFLSATLCEAVLMQEVLGSAFTGWFAGFLPACFDGPAICLTTPVTVTDRTDGRLAHLDGLNLSRAWCWRTLAPHTPSSGRAGEIADAHLASALPHLAEHYMGEHWLATFALMALSE